MHRGDTATNAGQSVDRRIKGAPNTNTTDDVIYFFMFLAGESDIDIQVIICVSYFIGSFFVFSHYHHGNIDKGRRLRTFFYYAVHFSLYTLKQ